MKINQQEWSRRKFIASASLAGLALILPPLISLGKNGEDPEPVKMAAHHFSIDTHNHIEVPLEKEELPAHILNLAGELKRSGLSGIVMTFATDYKKNIQAGEAYQRFLTGLSAVDKVLADNNITRAFNAGDCLNAKNKNKPFVIQSVEGCHFLEGKAERVEIAYKRGVRHLGLLHDSDASVPLGDVYTNAPIFGGLTNFGREVIKECNRLGILVDLTHASNDTINAALKISIHPPIISHTGLDTQLGINEKMAKMMQPRLISKEQAKIVAAAGGIIGVWTHLSDTPLAYAQNIRAMVDVTGVNHVCIGTDTKIATPSAASNNNLRAGEYTNEAWANSKTGFLLCCC